MSLAMVQFLVFAVEKFAASATNRQLMQKGVSTAFSVALKVGVVPSILLLQSFPVLESSSPELKSELHRIFPEHFPSADSVQVQAPSPLRSPAHMGSSGGTSPSGFHSPLSHGYAGESPVHSSPIETGSPTASPGRSPSHSDASTASTATSSDANALSSSSFLPDNQQSPEPSAEISTSSSLMDDSALVLTTTTEVPPSLLVLGSEDFKNFQDMLPAPGSRPTEGFLECLNDILISWIRQDNAVELAAPLGAYLHASLEKIIVSSKISVSESPKATCAGVLDSMLDQVVSEPHEVFVPFLQAMHTRDVSISFRLLAFCCSRASESKSLDAVLAPYSAFIDAIGGTLATHVVKDLTLSQHIDDARALACSLLETSAGTTATGAAKPSASAATTTASDEVGAVEATVLYIAPYLFANMHHASLGKLMARSETLVQLVVSIATPSMVHALASRVLLHECAFFRHRLANVLLSSLQWTSWEQFAMWDLVIAEVHASGSEKTLFPAARKVLACVNPSESAETLSGLLKCLVRCRPDASMLQAICKLSSAYDDFPLVLLSTWLDAHPLAVKSYVTSVLDSASTDATTLSKDVADVLGKLERVHAKRLAIAGGATKRSASPVLALLRDDAIAASVRKVVVRERSGSRSDAYPALAKALEELEQPKQSATAALSSESAKRESESSGETQHTTKKPRIES